MSGSAQQEPTEKPSGYLRTLCLGALGVVYGDIGTSPLYTIRECFHGAHGIGLSHDNVLGVLSLILWSLIVVVTIKYLVYVLRFDNRGEGGILALMGLLRARESQSRTGRRLLILLGLFGAALLYGDGMITPAISVLSAVEGLAVATSFFTPYVVPITIAILVALFAIQRRGTAGLGALFGPVTLLWFLTLAILGLGQIVLQPAVLAAINPIYGLDFLWRSGMPGFLVLGSVFLVATGGEALYADMGHFGTRPIRIDWFFLVFPSLVLNYFGQGALLLRHPEATASPFFNLAPSWALYPLVVLSTTATVIASQAMISGAFSLTRQAVQLGFLPRVEIVHTSSAEIGQIYIPGVNWALMASTIALVLGFRSSTNLAAAYGIAVTTTMVITTVLAYVVAREKLGWSRTQAGVVSLAFLSVELCFFGANIVKVAQGGWFPLLVAAFMFTLMTTWQRGRAILGQRRSEGVLALDLFLADVAANPPIRPPGTAVFMSGNASGIPPALLHNLKHNKVLHERVVLLTVTTVEAPHMLDEERVTAETLGHGFYRIVIRYGFMEDPDIPAMLARVAAPGLDFPPGDTTYFLGKETLIATPRPGMALWREHLFSAMSKNARTATAFFRLPPNRVVELGAQIEL